MRENPFLNPDHRQISASMAAKNWEELPRELLGQILKSLCITSIDSFKLVCHSWHSTVQEEAELSLLCPAPSLPWLTIPSPYSYSPNKINDDDPARLFNLVNRKVYRIEKKKIWPPPPEEAKCVGSSHGWLAFLDINCAVYLTNPFRPDKPSIQLPPIETLPCIKGKLGSSDFLYWSIDKDKAYYILESSRLCHYIITKLVLSSAPLSDEDEYTVMIIYGRLNELAFCKSGDTSWTKLYGEIGINHKDLYYSSNNQRFHVLSDYGDSIEVWDLRNSSWPKRTCIRLSPSVPPWMSTDEQDLRPWCYKKKYLAESCCGNLLLLVKYWGNGVVNNNKDKELRFDVHKLDWVKKEWVQVECLGEEDMLFLGINNAMSISASNFPGFQGNSIYFTDDSDSYCRYEGGYDLGVFSFEDNRVRPCHYPIDFKTISPSAVWISPKPW